VAAPVATIISFRLGGGDGVSIEAAKWAHALRVIGFEVRTVAGAGRADTIVPGLGIYDEVGPSRSDVSRSIDGADLVIVENLCSLPLNPRASEVVSDLLRGRRALFHHHDLPWQREQFKHYPPPPDDRSWAHVTINQLSRHQLSDHGIDSVVVRNTFDVEGPIGDRARGRDTVGFDPGARIVMQPTRAIPRKNVAGGIALAEALGATFWLLGPAEDGFGPELDRLVSNARCPVVLGHQPGPDEKAMADAYAACDVVGLPSTWEGFGNPAIESAVHAKPLAVGRYPVAAELASFGFRWFAADDPRSVAEWLESPDPKLLQHNRAVATAHFALADLPERLERLVDGVGWTF
jgi:glycosyltransferase involved in cell wall biosynthesis